MKRSAKKTEPLRENLIEHEESKGKNISIYLNAESLRYLDQLCKLFNLGRSQMIQQIILFNKQASLSIIPLLGGDTSPVAEKIRSMAFGGGEKAE